MPRVTRLIAITYLAFFSRLCVYILRQVSKSQLHSKQKPLPQDAADETATSGAAVSFCVKQANTDKPLFVAIGHRVITLEEGVWEEVQEFPSSMDPKHEDYELSLAFFSML